ncbi:hexokinase-domain-containing protein [Russula dissimulans]|nr:hexokinase-domain-containing protein [Russula dissimulans]
MPVTTAIYNAHPNAVLADIEQQFSLDQDTLLSITSHFHKLFNLGLSEYGHPMAMIPTFVTGVPDGTETGTFLALDLGGTNLRVCEVVLHGDKTFTLKQRKFRVSEALKTGEATVLFDYLADSVDAFLTSNTESDEFSRPSAVDIDTTAVPLGLTFSFPVEQTAIDKGILLTWTKGFSAKNAVDKDVVQLLQDAFDRKHLHVKCVALVNDTVGAALSRAYTTGGCVLGAIFGTGTNGAYLEQVANITKLGNSPAAAAGGVMMINTEWGAFDNAREVLPITPFDNKVDRESINPGFQEYEKFISGMYLGEITRNILLALVDAAPKPILFGGKATERLNKHYGLDTEMLSLVESAWTEGASAAPLAECEAEAAALRDFSGPRLAEERLTPATLKRLTKIQEVVQEHLGYAAGDVSLRDAALVQWAAALVVRRAARLSACAVATVAIQIGYVSGLGKDGRPAAQLGAGGRQYSIGIDGSLYQHYPGFEEMIREALRGLLVEDIEKQIEMGLAKDGSGVGAALGALQATKYNKS